jgi:predicted phage-related endonuclease
MKILDLVQGSDEWKAKRLECITASEAPAMMGASKYMTRNQLLDMKKGAAQKPIDKFTQALFDKGHAAEDSARKLLEINWLEDFPPVVGVIDLDLGIELLASFDGFNASMKMPWEHKLWNETVAENVRNKVLEPLHYWQLEFQMLVSDTNACTFTCSDGTDQKSVSMIYQSQESRRAELIAAVKQFAIDLEGHEIKAKTQELVAKKQDAFPSIECRVEGSVVVSNLGDYIPVIEKLAKEQMSIILESDQDFADKEAFNKNVKEGRASLKLKAGEIEEKFESLAEFNGYVAQADKILQKLQSHGEKQVKESKESKKFAITEGAHKEIREHLNEISKKINGVQIQGVDADWNAIIKGKRSFEKMQDAVDTEVANLKTQANEMAANIRKNLDTLTELAGGHKFLFSDHAELILKNNDDLINLIKARIVEHENAEKERIEQERQRIQEEEEAKAQREAEAKAEAEREKIRQEEREKAQAEEQAKRETVEASKAEAAPEDMPSVPGQPEVLNQIKNAVPKRPDTVIIDDPIQETDILGDPVQDESHSLLEDLSRWCEMMVISERSKEGLIEILEEHGVNI